MAFHRVAESTVRSFLVLMAANLSEGPSGATIGGASTTRPVAKGEDRRGRLGRSLPSGPTARWARAAPRSDHARSISLRGHPSGERRRDERWRRRSRAPLASGLESRLDWSYIGSMAWTHEPDGRTLDVTEDLRAGDGRDVATTDPVAPPGPAGPAKVHPPRRGLASRRLDDGPEGRGRDDTGGETGRRAPLASRAGGARVCAPTTLVRVPREGPRAGAGRGARRTSVGATHEPRHWEPGGARA